MREDAFGLFERYDDMSVEDINRFTKDDIVCALEMFNEDYVTFPRDDIAKDIWAFNASKQKKLEKASRSCKVDEFCT